MRILGIDHVQLAIPPGGEGAARRFYGEVLGLVEVPKPEDMRARGGMWFDGGIHLGIEEGMRPSLKMHPALVVDDLAAVKARSTSTGVTATRTSSPWSGFSATRASKHCTRERAKFSDWSSPGRCCGAPRNRRT